MARELISEIFDEDKIGQQVKNISTLITNWLTSTQKELKELTDKSIDLHLNIKSDTNFKDLIANMKEFTKVSQEIETANQKLTNVQNQVSATSRTAANATKELIFTQDRQKKSVEEMTAALDEAVETHRYYSRALEGSKKELADNSAALLKAKEQVKDFSKRLSDMQSKASWQAIDPKSIKELEEKLGNAAARVEEYTQKVKESKQEVKLAQTVEDGVSSSYEVREAMMKQLLAISKEMGNETQENKDNQQELAKAINALNDSLKESDEAYGNNQRNVGQYANATKNLRAVMVELKTEMDELSSAGKTNSHEYQELEKEYAKCNAVLTNMGESTKTVRGTVTDLINQMAALAMAGQQNSKEYLELQKKVTEYNKALMNTRKVTNSLRSNTASLDALRQSLQALNVAFMSLKQAGAFGEENEKLNAIMKKLQVTMALVSAAVQMYSLVGKNSLIIARLRTIQTNLLAKAKLSEAAATGKATIAQRLFNLVAKANPYLVLVSAIGAVIGIFALFSKSVSAAQEAQKDLNKAQKEAVKSVAEQASKIEILARQAQKANLTITQQKNIILQLNQAVKESGKEYKTWEEAQDFLLNKKDEYINALKERAKQQAILSEYTKAYQELLEKEQEKEQSLAEAEKHRETLENLGLYEEVIESINEKAGEAASKIEEKMTFLFNKLNTFEFNGFDDIKKQYNELSKTIENAGKNETQKLDEKYKEQEDLINIYFGKQIDDLQEKMKKELLLNVLNLEAQQKIRQKYAGLIQEQTDEQLKQINALYNMHFKDRQTIIEKTEDLRIRAMQDGFDKQIAALKAAQAKELKEVEKGSKDELYIINYYKKEEQKLRQEYSQNMQRVNIENQLSFVREGSQRELNLILQKLDLEYRAEIKAAEKTGADVAVIEEKYRKLREDAEKDNMQKAANVQQTDINNQLSYVKKGSEDEYNLKIQLLDMQRQAEITEAEKTGADVLAIDKKYEQLKREALQDRLGEQIKIELKAMEDRLTAMQQIQATEEKAVLERYKSGEINEEEYNKLIAEIKYKYSKEATEAELANLEKLLKAEGLSDEQIAELRKQLTEKNMELSDTETEHTLDNIKKETQARKKNAELAKEYAQQAFSMAMDFLTQQSQARQQALEEELERIEQWREAELTRLDESVMSEETRAEEEKRINAEADAEKKKIDEQLRAEKTKEFRYNQLQSIANAGLNIALGITKVIGQTGISAPIWIPIIAALGAAQIAMILAQKPPKYAKGIYGDDYHEGGLAIVGDAGKKEYGLLPSGKIFETPAFPTLVDLPKFTQIYPDFLTFTRTVNPIPHYEKNANKTADFDELKNSIVTAINKNKAVQNVSMNLDANGLWYIANDKGTTSKHINKRVNKR